MQDPTQPSPNIVSSEPNPMPTASETPPQVIAPSVVPPPSPPSQPSKRKFPFIPVLLVMLALVAASVMYIATNLLQTAVQPQNTPTALPGNKPGKIIIATDATFSPMEYLDDQNNFVGYDIELGTRIAQQMGVEAEFKNISWDNIFTSLENGEVDMIISAVTITEDRKAKYDFSDQYINAGQVIITRQENTTISKTEDLNGKKIAVQRGTTNEQQALQFTSKEMVLLYEDFIGATEALKNGEANAIFSDLTGAKGIVTQNPELKIASEPFTSDYYGIVFRKDKTALRDQVNSALEALKQQGVLVYLKQKWLE